MKRQKLDWLARLHAKTMHGICSGVSEHKSEVAGRIRFLAKFRQPRAIALGVAGVLLIGVGAFCLGGQGSVASDEIMDDAYLGGDSTVTNLPEDGEFNNAQSGDAQSDIDSSTTDPSSDSTANSQTTAAAATREEYTSWMAVLTHDGDRGLEEILWDDIAFAETGNEPLYVQSASMCNDLPRDVSLWQSSEWQSVSRSHAGQITYSLYQDDTGDYLLRYIEGWYNGSCEASYDLFSLSESGEEIIAAQGRIEILGEEMPYNGAQNDVEAIVSFLEAVAGYSANSAVLVSTNYDIAYCDTATGEVISGLDFIKGTLAQPIRFIPFMMTGYVTAQDDAGRQAAVDALRARLIEINEIRTEVAQTLFEEQQAQDNASMAEYGMVAPFRANRTYDTWVADSYNADPEDWQATAVAFLMQRAQGTTVTDKNGNKVQYSLAVADSVGGTKTTDYNSNLLLNETYWSGYYYGDLPDALDKSYYDFYYYADFQSMLSQAAVIPQGANLQLTVDTSAQGNHKKVRMIAYTCYASDGAQLGFDSVFYADEGEGDILTLEIPELDYQGEGQMMMHFNICMSDDTVPNPEDTIKFSLPCKVG